MLMELATVSVLTIPSVGEGMEPLELHLLLLEFTFVRPECGGGQVEVGHERWQAQGFLA